MLKSDGVQDVFKWLETRCKEQKKCVEKAQDEYEKKKSFFCYEDEECIVEAAKIDLEREKAKLDTLVKTKISVEKYMKKLRHQGE